MVWMRAHFGMYLGSMEVCEFVKLCEGMTGKIITKSYFNKLTLANDNRLTDLYGITKKRGQGHLSGIISSGHIHIRIWWRNLAYTREKLWNYKSLDACKYLLFLV